MAISYSYELQIRDAFERYLYLCCKPLSGASFTRGTLCVICPAGMATCRLHGINPYDYFVEVLQRVGQPPATLVHQLTPQIWKAMFADNPLRSDLHDLGGRHAYAGV